MEFKEGMIIRGSYSDGMVIGRVEHVMKDGMLGTPESKYKINASQEDPALLIRIFKQEDMGWEETEFFVGVKSSNAELAEDVSMKSQIVNDLEKASVESLDLRPTESMAANARRGLELRRKFGRGGTAVGVARARDLANRKELSPETVARMYSFFSRHEVDKKGKDWNNSERPSNGKIAWLLWGGDSGYSWARSKWNAIQRIRSQKSVWLDSPLSFNKHIDN